MCAIGDDFRPTPSSAASARTSLPSSEATSTPAPACCAWHEAFSAGRALQAVAASGMSEDELALAVWHWLHPQGRWEWKHRERLRYRLGDDEK